MLVTLSALGDWLKKDGLRDLVFVAGLLLFSFGVGLIVPAGGLIAAGAVLLYVSLFPRK